MNTIQRIILLVILIVLPTALSAKGVEIKGKIIDKSSGVPIEYADVIVTDLSDKVLGSAIASDGLFSFADIDAGELLITVRAIGYETYVSDVFRPSGETAIDVGTISLSVSAHGLDELTVVGEKSRIVYKLDRRRIGAQNNVTASGGTAVDVLSTAPSVQIDADGELTLRGSSNFLVYVDGKLSPLTGTQALQQIPAGTIDDIEIITTPSARYRTDGDVGIINITTKSLKMSGWSGIANVSGSTLGTHSVDARINNNRGNNNWWFGGTWQAIKSKSNFLQNKTTTVDDYTTISASDGSRFRTQKELSLKGGWQYADKKHHTLSLDVYLGNTKRLRGGDMLYDEHRRQADAVINDNTYNSHDRYRLEKEFYQFAADYTWRINPNNSLNARLRMRFDSFSMEYTESNMFDLSGNRYEGTRGYEHEHHGDHDAAVTYNFNYSGTGCLEAGYQYTYYSEHGNYKIKYWDNAIGDFHWNSDPIPFYYRREVHSGYAQLNDSWQRFSFDAGVRVDRVIDRMEIDVPGADRHIRRLEFYPSAHVGYDIPEAGTLRLGYSRRTNRPGIWQLEPYITYEDYYTKKIGNPDINPEYIHSLELGWNKQWRGGHSASLSGYFRHRSDVIDVVRVAYEPGVTLDSIINAGNQVEMGLEMSLVAKPVKWFTTMLNGSVFHYDFNSHYTGCTDSNGVSGQVAWVNTFNVGDNVKLQLDSHFVAPMHLTQGKEYAYVYFDAAYRHTLARGMLTLSVVAHNVFHTAKYHNYRTTASLLSETWVKPKYPNIVASVTFNFNAFKGKTTAVAGGSLFEGKEF